ncbi:MAG TPA: hypothetical protein VFE47_04050 [Tepidisphaeraceae bacterium]|jgi:hypothetical protein|nr:hypothetical protein [Tepidisphaeraceae bacterium]
MKRTIAQPRKRPNKEMSGVDFDALPPAEKERIFNEIETGTPEQRRAESRPLNKAEQARWNKVKRKAGRPRIGKGIKLISLSIERGLLDRADSYARAHKISRAQLIARGIVGIIGEDRKAKAG